MKLDPILKVSALVVILYLMTVGVLFLLNVMSQDQVIGVTVKFLIFMAILGIGSFLIKLVAFNGSKGSGS